MSQPIFLCGFMGVGKSTVGKLLAQKLKCPFYDTDQMITESAGQTVAEIFLSGEEKFRMLESEEIMKLQVLPAGVVALGGGALKDPVNLRCVQKAGTLIYLGANPATLQARLQSEARPLLQGHTGEDKLQKISSLLETREIIYQSADITVRTDGKSPEAVTEEILQELKRGKS